MTSFCLHELSLENYRCFEALTLSLEGDTTVLFAENGGGKSALLTAIALGFAPFMQGDPKPPKLDARRDSRMQTIDERGRREPVGTCTLTWTAAVDGERSVHWSTSAQPASGRAKREHQAIQEAIEGVRVPGDRWPLFAWYGVDRMGRSGSRRRRSTPTQDRWEAYASSLDPSLGDAPLLQWLQDEMLGDVVRREQGEPERYFHKAVLEATVRATPGVINAWYDPVGQEPRVRFENDRICPWSELSDGYHVFIALVADIARRAVMLNEIDGAEAPQRLEGVVLIDELDLHLHPRWQRVVLPSLRKAFPRLQLVVTTHSPQVLSSAENRQVRLFVDGTLWDREVLVSGRDTNAIMREYFRTEDRDEKGVQLLQQLEDAIEAGRANEARELYELLIEKWGHLEPQLIRRKSRIDALD